MDAKVFKRLPYGNSNFESIQTENYVFIDKTPFIEKLEEEENKYLFFIRPRKFGKSLLLSMLSHYYDIKQADKFDTLFGDLYIGKHPTPNRNSYMVLNLDFSGMDTSDEASFKKSFAGNIQDTVRGFLNKYSYLVPKADIYFEQIGAEQSGVNALRKTFNAAEDAGRKLFIIIDEYDHFANDLIAQGNTSGDDVYRHITRANGTVRDFYEILKAGSKTVIDRIMLTGITPIMLDDLTSGFNISNNLSLKAKYNEMLGFTQDEVQTLMLETGVDQTLINVDMEFLYNGYLFHEDGAHRVYNPTMMLYFFHELREEGKPPKNIIDENLKTDYGRLQRLVNNEPNRLQLLKITQDNGVFSDIVAKFPVDKLHDNKYFISLLFYMGLLTIDNTQSGRLRLKIPNYSIRTIFWEYIEQLTLDRNKDIMISYTDLGNAIWELAYKGNARAYMDYISRHIFSCLSNRDLQNFDEKYIKILLLSGLFQSKLFIPVTEPEVSTGYADIWLKRSHRLPDIPYEWVWELKYISKKEEAGKKKDIVKEKLAEARVQLKKYRDSHLFAYRTDVRFLSVIFIGKDKYEMEEVQ